MTCPTCGGVLADMRGRTMFKPIEAKTVGVCALWSDGNYECAFKDRPRGNVKVHTPDDVIADLLTAGVNLTLQEQKIVKAAIQRRDEVWQTIVEVMRT